MRKRSLKRAGFTLVELLMVIVILGVISVVVGRSLYQALQTFLTAQNISEADWQGFVALERIVDDIYTIRSAGSLSTISASNFVFTDVNGNTVQFQRSGNTLLRNSQTLATGVTGLTFGYRDKNGSTTAVPSAVRYITIAVTLTQDNVTTSFSIMAGTRGMQ